MLSEHASPIEADLQHYYQIDLRDLWRPRGGPSHLTYRRLGVLLEHLPGDSAYKSAARDSYSDEQLAEWAKRAPDKYGRWSHEALRMANIEDLLGMLVRGLRVTGDWKPVPRPGVPRTASSGRRALSAEGYAYLRKIREDHERAHGYGIGAQHSG